MTREPASTRFDPSGAVLLLVDFQKAFDTSPWPARWNDRVDANALAVLAAFRAARLPVIHIRHDSVEPASSLAPGQPGNAFGDGFAPEPGEALVVKSVNAAFIGTDLDLRLRRLKASALYVCGISTDMCVSTTIRTGANLGWSMILIEGACDCFDLTDTAGTTIPALDIHRAHIASLAFEFCSVVTARNLVAQVDGADSAAR
jgi:nicotinamidase-related amidase